MQLPNSSPLQAPFLAFVLLLTLLSSISLAGNGPQNYLLVYDPSSVTGTATANYYKQARGFPESNLFAYSFPRHTESGAMKRVISTPECYALISSLRSFITSSGLNQIHGVILAGETPLNVQASSATNPTEKHGSIVAALWYAPNVKAATDLDTAICQDAGAVGYLSAAFSTTTTSEVRSDKSFGSHRYWLATHLGYTGARGLRLPEVFSLLDRSKLADGTKEKGTIYWPINDNVRSRMREGQISTTTANWDSLGLAHYVFGTSRNGTYGGDTAGRTIARDKNLPPANADIQNRAVQGMVCGFPSPQNLEFANNRYTQGAIAEHVTSFGGVMGEGLFASFENVGPQMAHSEWLRWGVCGSSGTVTEPSTIADKFPHSTIHSHYFRGATLAEAFLQSVKHPRQLLVSGDPLCQPYASLPTVTLSGITEGATISGTVTIQVSVAGGAEASRDLFVGGKRIASSNGNFSLNTTQLPEGYHELRVVAYANNALRSQGSALRRVRVKNTAANVTISASSTSVSYRGSVNVTATLSGLNNVARVEIVSNGAVLAQLGAAGGSANLKGSAFGFNAVNRLFAVAVRNDGTEVWSMPVELTLTWPNLTPNTVTVGTALATANLWTDGTGANFNWTQPNQTALVTDREFLIYQNSDSGNGNITIDFPMVTTAMLNKAAMEFVTYFDAKETGFYDFAIARNCGVTLIVNGQTLINTPTPSNNPGGITDLSEIHYGTERMAAGRHEIRIRVKQIKSKSGFRIGVRSSYARLVPRGDATNGVLDFVQLGNGGNCAAAQAGNPQPGGETFTLLNQSSNGAGSFTGDARFSWSYSACQHQDSGISGRSLRTAYGTGSSLSATVPVALSRLTFKIRNAVTNGVASEYGVNVYVNGTKLPGSPFLLSTMGALRTISLTLTPSGNKTQLRFENAQRAILLDDITWE